MIIGVWQTPFSISKPRAMLGALAFWMDSVGPYISAPCAVNLHHAVTVSQQRLGKRVAQLSPARMNEVCALRFSLGCDSNWLLGTFRVSPGFKRLRSSALVSGHFRMDNAYFVLSLSS